PGPQFPLYCAGARLDAIYPVSVVTDGMGLNITVMSYCGQLHFGIVADRDMVPDIWTLLQWLGEELDELMNATPAAGANGAGEIAEAAVPEGNGARPKAKTQRRKRPRKAPV